jgi:hypothetical protein
VGKQPVAAAAMPAGPGAAKRERVDLRTDLPPGHKRLIQSQVQAPPIKVVGESYRRDTIEAAVGVRSEGHRTLIDATLVAEPDNPYDPNAIAVHFAGTMCGYFSRLDARRYRPVMEWAQTEGFVPVVRADVGGGWQKDDGSWADFGIRLYVATPDELLGRAAAPLPVAKSEHPWVGQVIAFTGDSRCAIAGEKLDRARSEEFVRAAGMEVHARVTRSVQLLIDCDDSGVSGNQRKAIQYGVPVVSEYEFWMTVGLPVEMLD